jgi:citrate synthase
LTLI